MEYMKVVLVSAPDALEHTVDTIKRGGVVVFPTDTAYGLGVDATNDSAVEKLFALKGRSKDKPMHVVVSDIDMANRYVVMDKRARALAQAFLPGPLTLVLENKRRVSRMLVGEGRTLGIRIPDNAFARELAARAQTPITATSANKSGDDTPYCIKEVKKSFSAGSRPASGLDEIDLVIDAGELARVAPSTLVDLTNDAPQIIREGPISREEILRVLG